MSTKRKAIEAELPPTKKSKPRPPKHGQRLFFEATVFWLDQYGRKKGDNVKLLLDCGCTGPILNKDFVKRNHIPWVRRTQPITVQTVDGKPMEDAGEKHTEDLVLRIGAHQEELSWEISTLEEGIDGYLPISWLQQHNPDVQWDTGKMTWRSEYCRKHCLPMSVKDAAKGFIQMIQEGKEWMSSYCRAAAAGKVWHNAEGGDVADDLPEQYRQWASVFSEEEVNKLPEHSSWDHHIDLVEGATPPYGPIYPLNEKELGVLREYISKMMAAGKIQLSKSSAGSPILFVPKADGTLRLQRSSRSWICATVTTSFGLPRATSGRLLSGRNTVFSSTWSCRLGCAMPWPLSRQ